MEILPRRDIMEDSMTADTGDGTDVVAQAQVAEAVAVQTPDHRLLIRIEFELF